MSVSETGQVSRNAADVYEEFFVPALFLQWTGQMIDAARIKPGDCVLDVACGTGVLTRAIANRVGSRGSAVGLDINDGMLAVARKKSPAIEWIAGRAEALPLEDESFDAVVSQFALMFFEDQPAALSEMLRVLRPGGRLAVAVWGALDVTPGYAAMVNLLLNLFGKEAADALRAPYVLGDVQHILALGNAAGIASPRIETLEGVARFPSLNAWVYTDIKGWTLSEMLDDDQFELLLRESHQHLIRFVTPDGAVEFEAPAHILTATKT